MPPSKLCDYCGAKFTRAHDLKRHVARKHTNTNNNYICEICNEMFPTSEAIASHREVHKPQPDVNEYKVVEKSLRGVVCLYEKIITAKSIEEVFTNTDDIKEILQYETSIKRVIKASIDVLATFVQYDHSGQISDTVTITLRSQSYTLLRGSDMNEFISACQTQIVARAHDFTDQGSGWVLQYVLKQHISIAKTKSLIGGCGTVNLANRLLKYVIDPKNTTPHGCFYTCIAISLCSVEAKLGYEDKLSEFIDNNINKVDESIYVHINQISHFLSRNKHLNIGINVVLCENGNVLTPVYCSKNDVQKQKRISLVLVYEDNAIGHYMLIKDFNSFVKTSYKDSTGAHQYKKYWFCFNCLTGYYDQSTLKKHVELCNKHETQKTIIPESGEKLFFKDLDKTYLAPLIGFLDFESFLSKTKSCNICVSDCIHKTSILNQHTPFSWSLVVIDINNDIILQKSYVGLDCGEKLIEYLLECEDMLLKLVKTDKPLKLTHEEESIFAESFKCEICFREITNVLEKRRHHHHYTGEFIGAAHNTCNMNCRAPNHIPIYVHNLAAYDAMFLVQALGKIKCINESESRTEEIKVKVLPHNTERIRTMSINSYNILDSMDLFHASLASLVDDLNVSNHNFPLLKKSGIYNTDLQRTLLLTKGVYPYAYGQSISQLASKREIPHRRYFYSDISAEPISEDAYSHAHAVFKAFNLTNMLEYSQLYCLLDVYLLAECVLHFRQVIYKASKLDCCAFLSAAHLAFNIFLKTTGTVLDLLSDPEQILFIQENIRGGLSFVNMRYAEKTKHTNLMIIDQNNLYGHSQCQLLPHSNYRWLSDLEKQTINWQTIPTNSEWGYIVECTLTYPKHLHKTHNDFPLAPEQMEITYEDLSPYSKG